MKLKITVHGVAYEVDVEVLDPGEGFPASPSALPNMPQSQSPTAPVAAPSAPPPRPQASGPVPSAGGSGSVTSPIAGTVIEVKVKPGQTVNEGDILLIIEAMKMNTSIAAPSGGTVKTVPVAAGDSVREGELLVEFS